MRSDEKDFFEALYRDCFPLLLRRAEKELGDTFLAQDVTQDTFHTALNRLDEVIAHENPKGWLIKVMDNKIKHVFQERTRDCALFLSIEEGHYVEPNELDPRIVALETGRGEALKKIREILTKDEFYFIIRLVLEKASHRQLAEEFHMTVYGSKKKRERILHKLHKNCPEIVEEFRKKDKKKKV